VITWETVVVTDDIEMEVAVYVSLELTNVLVTGYGDGYAVVYVDVIT